MSHHELRLLVSSYIDGELTSGEKANVLTHLEVCSECRDFLENAKIIRTEIQSLDHIELPNTFASHITHSVSHREEQIVEWLGVEPSARNTFCVIAIVVLLMFVFTSFNNSTSSVSADQLLGGITSDSVATYVLLKQGELTGNDLLYAVLTK